VEGLRITTAYLINELGIFVYQIEEPNMTLAHYVEEQIVTTSPLMEEPNIRA
jgi:hypothetical protein